MRILKHGTYSSFLRSSYLLAALVLALSLHAATLRAQETVTLQGEIIDMACYMSKGSKGAQHKACAQMCAKKGVPVGLLTDSGDVFLLVDDHDDSEPYEDARKLAGERAEVTGKKYAKGGVATIVVGSAKGL